MPINFDPNSLNSVFDKNFGAGAYNAGLSNAAKAARLKQQASFAKSDFLKRLSAAQAKAKKDQEYMDKYGMTYDAYQAKKEQDKLNKLQDKYQVLDNGLTSDQASKMRSKAESQGRGGHQPSYDQQRKEAQQSAKNSNDLTSYDTSKMTPHNQELVNKMIADKNKADQQQQQQKKSSPGLLSKIGNGLKGIGSEIGAAATAAEQFVNPFDKVSADQAVKNYMNRNQSQGFQDVARGANRAVDSASLGLMSNLDKKLNNRTPYYNSARAFGQGGGTDMITSGLGFLVPGVGAAKGVKALGLGAKSIPTLEKGAGLMANLARGSQVARTVAKEGALVGGALPLAQMGINYAINPKDQNLKDNLANVALGAGLGAVGDPILRGLGSAGGNVLAKFAKGDIPTFTGKPSQSTLDALSPKASPSLQSQLNGFRQAEQQPIKANISQLPLNQSKVLDNIQALTGIKPKQPKTDVSNSPLFMSLNPSKTAEKMNPKPNLTPIEQQYQNELNQAVQQQVDYLKNSMGKGVDRGITSNGQPGNFKEVTGTYNVSQNPKWYQDFYKTNGRKPNNAELQQLAQEHVLNGFQDEYGNIPSFVPKKIQDINDQIDQAMAIIKQQPEQAPVLQSYLDALAQEKTTAEEEYKQFLMKTNLQMFGKNEPKATNISPQSPKNDVTAPNPLDNHGYGLALANDVPKGKTSAPTNKFDYPYNPNEPLPNTRDQIGTKTAKSVPSVSQTATKTVIKTIDNLHRLDQFDNQVSKVLGRDLKASESTHTLGLNSRGTDMISKQILTQNMVDKNGDIVGKSLKDITMKVPKGKLKDFEDYLINKHAITRMERGEKVFPDEMKMSPAKSEAIVKNYEQQNPSFKDIAKEYYNYNKQLGQKWLVDTGILSKDQWEGYLKANPNYVPNNRIFSDLERPLFTNNAKKGFANQTNPVKKAVGSQRQIVSPIESTIEHTSQYVKTAKRNEVMQTLITNIQQNPKAFEGWAEIVPTDKTPQSILDTLNKDGVDGVLEELNQGFKQKPDLTKGNIIRGLVDGNPVHVKVHDPELLDALTNLTPRAQHVIINAAGQLTRMMKTLTTGINPVFSLTRNIFRDIPTAYVNSKSTNNPLTFSKDLVQSVVSILKNDKLYRSFKAVGGGHSSPISSDVNLLAQSKRSILPGEKGLWNNTKRLGGKALGALENLNNAVESAPRLAEFKRIAGNTYDSKMKALYEANDVTVNFNKYGNWTKEADALIPYLNAAVQGLDKMGRVFFSPKASKAEKTVAAVKAFTAITIPSMLMFTVNHNDPNYQKVSNYIKDTNILIPKGDGTFFKIPKPRELGVVFGSDVERALRAWADQDPKAFDDFTTTLWDNFKPPVRTTFAPFNDLRANKNFMDAPIIPADMVNLPPQYQYDSKTSEPAKLLGKMLKKSPMQIDYLTKSYGGVLGELGIPLTTKDGSVGNTLKQKVTVDPVFSNDILRNFYDAKTKLDQAHSALTKQGVNTPDLNEALRKQFSNTSTQIGKVRKQIKQTQNNQALTSQQRLDQIRKLQEYMNQLALQANQYAR